MVEGRTREALRRIEQAMARIDAAAARLPQRAEAPDSHLEDENRRLRRAMEQVVGRIDRMIGSEEPA